MSPVLQPDFSEDTQLKEVLKAAVWKAKKFQSKHYNRYFPTPRTKVDKKATL